MKKKAIMEKLKETHKKQFLHRGVTIFEHDTPNEPLMYYFSPPGCKVLLQRTTLKDAVHTIDLHTMDNNVNKINQMRKDIENLLVENEKIKKETIP